MIDLDAYLARIGYAGSRDVNAETLRGVHRAHLYAVPFENLDVVLKRPIKLDPASLEQKIVAGRPAAIASRAMRSSCTRCRRWASR